MLDKTPESYSMITYLWVLVLSVWAGMASHLHSFRLHNKRDFDFIGFFVDILISAFVGVLTFFLCESAEIDPLLTAVLVGVSSHMGARSIYLFQHFLICKYAPEYCDDIKAQQNNDRDNKKD